MEDAAGWTEGQKRRRHGNALQNVGVIRFQVIGPAASTGVLSMMPREIA